MKSADSVRAVTINQPATGDVSDSLSVSVIVLTMGDRPAELEELVASFTSCQPFQGVLVGNGVAPPQFPGWDSYELEENIGISAGRAYGADQATGDLLAFIDDDAKNLTSDLLQRARSAFAAEPDLAAIALRVVVEGTDRSLSEWQPRIRGRGETVPGDVTSFHGAAHIVRAEAYRAVGGYPDNFWYAHEETDLAWRLLDTGGRIAYRPDLVLSHPPTKPSRHNKHLWYSARNRIFLARRHLPLPWAIAYAAVWLAIQILRCRSFDDVKAVLRGTAAGAREPAGARAPISWQTITRMTRLGRPPLI